jgi:hypothetical protein
MRLPYVFKVEAIQPVESLSNPSLNSGAHGCSDVVAGQWWPLATETKKQKHHACQRRGNRKDRGPKNYLTLIVLYIRYVCLLL